MFGVNLYGQAPYGAVVSTNKIITILDGGNGTTILAISNAFNLLEIGTGVDIIGGEYSKIIVDSANGNTVIQIIVPVNLIDSGVFVEALGGRRWVMQRVGSNAWTVTTATSTAWTEEANSSQVWTEEEEIE